MKHKIQRDGMVLIHSISDPHTPTATEGGVTWGLVFEMETHGGLQKCQDLPKFQLSGVGGGGGWGGAVVGCSEYSNCQFRGKLS